MTNSMQITNTLNTGSVDFLENIGHSEAQAEQEWSMNLIHQLPAAIVTEPAPDQDLPAPDEEDDTSSRY